jgi:hypothetical protein
LSFSIGARVRPLLGQSRKDSEVAGYAAGEAPISRLTTTLAMVRPNVPVTKGAVPSIRGAKEKQTSASSASRRRWNGLKGPLFGRL